MGHKKSGSLLIIDFTSTIDILWQNQPGESPPLMLTCYLLEKLGIHPHTHQIAGPIIGGSNGSGVTHAPTPRACYHCQEPHSLANWREQCRQHIPWTHIYNPTGTFINKFMKNYSDKYFSINYNRH
jgi:hypothetical protein